MMGEALAVRLGGAGHGGQTEEERGTGKPGRIDAEPERRALGEQRGVTRPPPASAVAGFTVRFLWTWQKRRGEKS